MHTPSRPPSQSGSQAQISSKTDAAVIATSDDATGRPTRTPGRVSPSASAFGASFSSTISSIFDDEMSPSASTPRHGGRQREKRRLVSGSLRGKDAADPGPLVWVRVTRSGELVPSECGSDERSYWWPASVNEGRLTSGPLAVSLYGEVSLAAPRSIRLEAPSPSHILPFKWPGQDTVRFTSLTFRCPEIGPRQDESSSLKRPKIALDEAWRAAVDLAHEADANLNDGLPSCLSSYKVRTREGKTGMSASTSGPRKSSERWSPPPCDPLLEIPGELVFSLEKRKKSEYWAARVEKYLPPKTPAMPPRYQVRFKDDSCRAVTRDMFYTSDEPEFYTCKLGRYLNDNELELSEVDSDDEPVPYKAGVDDEPTIRMPPPNPKEFCQMPIRDQFGYVKPVIKAILNIEYLPARERHQAFMQGGSSRLRLRRTATGKGDLTSREVSRFGRVLQHWVLGPIPLQKATPPPSSLGDLASESGVSSWIDIQDEQALHLDTSASLIGNDSPQASLASLLTSIGPSESLRPIGSPSYEALSDNDKLQYCLLVLFHEATLQLLLWRSGERLSLGLLSPDEEERLRSIGLAKSEERAWVREISRMRAVKATRSGHTSPPQHHDAVNNTSSSGRILRARKRPHVD